MATAAEMVQLYTDAEAKVLKGQSVSMNGRSLTYVNLQEIRAGRLEWERRANAEKSPGRKSGYSLARFD